MRLELSCYLIFGVIIGHWKNELSSIPNISYCGWSIYIVDDLITPRNAHKYIRTLNFMVDPMDRSNTWQVMALASINRIRIYVSHHMISTAACLLGHIPSIIDKHVLWITTSGSMRSQLIKYLKSMQLELLWCMKYNKDYYISKGWSANDPYCIR